MVQSKLKTMVYISLLVAQALVIGLIENMIPYPFGFAPGAKMGLANLITIIAIFTLSKRETITLIGFFHSYLITIHFNNIIISILIFITIGVVLSIFA